MQTIFNIKKLFERRKFLRNNSTNQEILLWLQLKDSKLDFKFRRQHSIGGYIVDFYCPTKKLVVEIDGLHHGDKENLEYDRVRSDYLSGFEINVLRFTNKEIDNNIKKVIKKILSELNR